MKKALIIIFTILIVLVFIILAFNYNRIVEMPFFESVPTIVLEVGGDPQPMGPYAWIKDGYQFSLLEYPSTSKKCDFYVSYNNYDVGTFEGYVSVSDEGYKLDYIILPELKYTLRCIRFNMDYDLLNDFGVFNHGGYLYYLRDEWPISAGFCKFARTRDGDVSTDVYCYLIKNSENTYNIDFIDVPVSAENMMNSFTSTLNYLNKIKPTLPEKNKSDDLVDSVSHFFDSFIVIFWEYPAHYFKYISCFLEDFYITWDF